MMSWEGEESLAQFQAVRGATPRKVTGSGAMADMAAQLKTQAAAFIDALSWPQFLQSPACDGAAMPVISEPAVVMDIIGVA